MLITLQQLKSSLQAVKNYINNVMPNKTSDLTNDSGFITNATVPIATTSKSGATTTLTVTDKNGTTTAQILDGAKGDSGECAIVAVSGTSPSITAEANTRYICGEVTSLSFTPCVSGICDVQFTSGSTVTVLTIPNTVKFPNSFDPTSLETNKIYEINILDGIYGVVTSWAI